MEGGERQSGETGVWDSRSGGITYRGVSQKVEFSQRMNRTPESSPNRATALPDRVMRANQLHPSSGVEDTRQ